MQEMLGLKGDFMTWVGNGLSMILAGVAIAGGVIGLLVGFDIIGTTSPFQYGVLWLTGAAVASVAAMTFRREHHVISEAEAYAISYDEREREDRPAQRGGRSIQRGTQSREELHGRDIEEFIGKPVIAMNEAREVGEVKDVLFDATERGILGLLVAPAGQGDARMFVGRDHLRGFGRDAVTIQSENNLQSFASKERERQVLEAGIDIRGAKVISERGDEIGKIDKILVNDDGSIVGYRASSGMPGIGDKCDIRPDEVISIGQETIIVRDSTGSGDDSDSSYERQRRGDMRLAGGDEGTGVRERRGSRMDEPYESQGWSDERTTTGGSTRYEEHPDEFGAGGRQEGGGFGQGSGSEGREPGSEQRGGRGQGRMGDGGSRFEGEHRHEDDEGRGIRF